MKNAIRHLSLVAAAAAALAAFPATAEPEAVESGARPGPWRVSVGYRVAPGIKTSAGIDAGAAARAAGLLSRPRPGSSSSSGGGAATTSSSVSVSTEDLGTTRSGTSEADASGSAEYSPDKTRYEFENGFIDLDDGTESEGDTMNWQFTDAGAFADGYISSEKPFSQTTTSRSRTTETETTVTRTPAVSTTTRSSSFSEWYADGLSGSSTETGQGVEIRLDRTLWDNGRFGADFGIGWALYDEMDCYRIRGRAYSAKSTERTVTRTEGARETTVTRKTTTETTTETTESGSVVTKIDAREFELEDIYNPEDGTIGAAYVEGGELRYGRAPVLAVGPETFSTETVRNPAETSTETTTATTSSTSTKAGAAKTSTTSHSRSRVVDVRSDGTLSLQELRCGIQPYWRAMDWLAFRADLGILAIYSEIETRTELFVDGKSAAVIKREKTDWTFAGYAGLGVSVAVARHVELFANAEARFPDGSLHFDDGIASGKIDLAEMSASAGVCVRF